MQHHSLALVASEDTHENKRKDVFTNSVHCTKLGNVLHKAGKFRQVPSTLISRNSKEILLFYCLIQGDKTGACMYIL